jgi:hypothetical protein
MTTILHLRCLFLGLHALVWLRAYSALVVLYLLYHHQHVPLSPANALFASLYVSSLR